MTDKEFIREIINIVNTTNDTYTEDRACGFDDIKILVNKYLDNKYVYIGDAFLMR